MTALQLVPEALWWLIFTVTIFWFGTKTINSTMPIKWKMPPGEVLQHIQQMLAARQQTSNFTDESKPLSDEAIKEWNKRNNPQ